MANEMQRDDELFQALAQNKKRRRRRILITVLAIILVAAVALTITVLSLRKTVRERYGFDTTQILSYTVRTGTLSTVVSGSGVLAEEDLEELTVPAGVEITQVLAEEYAPVTQGQLLALVDPASVLTAMSALQEELETLDGQISEAEDDKLPSSVTTGVAGRVKAIYAQEGIPVSQCMVEHGALVVLSLDGYMALQIPAGDLKAGDQVTIVLSGGKDVPGTVDQVYADQAEILITDDGPRLGEEATVLRDQQVLGSGNLYIHEPLAITGYAGTVQTLMVQENRKVTKGSTLLRLTDTATSAQYDTLLRQRREQEETLMELLQLQRYGGVTAPFAGSIYTVDYDEDLAPTQAVTLSRDQKMTITLTVDETDILSLEEGQQAEITIPSLGEEVLMGTVTEVDRTLGATGGYSAAVTLNKEAGMLSGMTADVNIRITGVENALLIPIEALQQTRTGSFVYTSYDSELGLFGGETPVTAGIQGSNEIEILSGLAEGDVIWYTEEQTIFDFFMSMGGMGGGNRGGSSGGSAPAAPATPAGNPPQGFDPGGRE